MSINWGALVEQGRAKAINIPWSDEELKALNEYKIPVEMVRLGVVTPEEYLLEQEPVTDSFKLLRTMTKDDLEKLAHDLDIVVPHKTHRSTIISLIKNSKLPVPLKVEDDLEEQEQA